MAVHEIIPNENVLVADIGNTLNANGGSVNINQPATYFSANAKLNKWSRNKPFIDSTNFFDSSASRANARFYAYQGFDKNSCPYFTNLYNMIQWLESNGTSPDPTNGKITEPFKYLLPTGGTSSPYRLEDFIGYDTDAKEPISKLTDEYIRTEDNVNYTFKWNANSPNGSSLTLTDLRFYLNGDYDLNTFYLGVAISDGTNKVARLGSGRMNNVDKPYEITTSLPDVVKGSNYTNAFAFLSRDTINTNAITSSSHTGLFVPLLWTKSPVFILPDVFGTEVFVAAVANTTLYNQRYYKVYFKVKIVCKGTNIFLSDNGKVVVNGGAQQVNVYDGMDLGGTTIYNSNPNISGNTFTLQGTYLTDSSYGIPVGTNQIMAECSIYHSGGSTISRNFIVQGDISYGSSFNDIVI